MHHLSVSKKIGRLQFLAFCFCFFWSFSEINVTTYVHKVKYVEYLQEYLQYNTWVFARPGALVIFFQSLHWVNQDVKKNSELFILISRKLLFTLGTNNVVKQVLHHLLTKRKLIAGSCQTTCGSCLLIPPLPSSFYCRAGLFSFILWKVSV